MVESPLALSNIDEIASVAGIDGILVGPNDLALRMGHTPGHDDAHPDVLSAAEAIFAACARHDIPAGFVALNLDDARVVMDKGAGFILLRSDMYHVASGTTRDAAALREIRDSR